MSRWGTTAAGPAAQGPDAHRKRTVHVALAAVLLFALLGAAAVMLSDGQREQRRAAEQRFAERAQVSATLTQSVFGALGAASGSDLQRRFGGEGPSLRRALAAMFPKSRLRYIAIVDARGRPLASAAAPRGGGRSRAPRREPPPCLTSRAPAAPPTSSTRSPSVRPRAAAPWSRAFPYRS